MRTAICALLCCAAFQLTLGQSEAFLASSDVYYSNDDVYTLANIPVYENTVSSSTFLAVMDKEDSDGLMEGFWDEVIYDEVGIDISEDDDFFMDFDHETQEDKKELWENYGIPEYYIEKSEWFITEDWLKGH